MKNQKKNLVWKQKRTKVPTPRCHLPPYRFKEFLSAQEVGEVAGWQITAMDVDDAWEHSLGEGVTVAILDSGCDCDHPDLVENLLVLPGANIIDPRLRPEDDNKHGTHCMGIVCAARNGIGMVGVAPKAKGMPIKVLDDTGGGDMSHVIKGVKFAIDNGADIISMSLGCPMELPSLRNIIREAYKRDIPVICAAGNAGDIGEIFYPAKYPETISVGCVDKNFNRATFSNTGDRLDFMAPGVDIFSTVPSGWYGVMSGTSMSAPFVSGLMALMLACARKKETKLTLKTVEEYRSLIRKSAFSVKDMKVAGNKFYEGFGIVDPDEIMDAITPHLKQRSRPVF